jgi:hypothetical protein
MSLMEFTQLHLRYNETTSVVTDYLDEKFGGDANEVAEVPLPTSPSQVLRDLRRLKEDREERMSREGGTKTTNPNAIIPGAVITTPEDDSHQSAAQSAHAAELLKSLVDGANNSKDANNATTTSSTGIGTRNKNTGSVRKSQEKFTASPHSSQGGKLYNAGRYGLDAEILRASAEAMRGGAMRKEEGREEFENNEDDGKKEQSNSTPNTTPAEKLETTDNTHTSSPAKKAKGKSKESRSNAVKALFSFLDEVDESNQNDFDVLRTRTNSELDAASIRNSMGSPDTKTNQSLEKMAISVNNDRDRKQDEIMTGKSNNSVETSTKPSGGRFRLSADNGRTANSGNSTNRSQQFSARKQSAVVSNAANVATKNSARSSRSITNTERSNNNVITSDILEAATKKSKAASLVAQALLSERGGAASSNAITPLPSDRSGRSHANANNVESLSNVNVFGNRDYGTPSSCKSSARTGMSSATGVTSATGLTDRSISDKLSILQLELDDKRKIILALRASLSDQKIAEKELENR